MKVLIIAGGYATRLWPITSDHPKALLPLGEKVILDHILEKLEGLNLDTYISTNRTFAEQFAPHAEGRAELLVEESSQEEEKPGAVAALNLARERLGTDDYLFIAGDNLFSFSLGEFLRSYSGKTLIAAYDIGSAELAGNYGVVQARAGKALEIEEKPASPKSTIISTGVYAFPRAVMESIDEYLSTGSTDLPGHFIQWLLSRGEEISTYHFDGYWYDIGSAHSYLEAMRTLLKQSHIAESEIGPHSKIIPPVVIERGADITGHSTIGPHVQIGEACTVEESEITRSVVFRKTSIKNSNLSHSITAESCEISNLELKNSLLGAHTKIMRGD